MQCKLVHRIVKGSGPKKVVSGPFPCSMQVHWCKHCYECNYEASVWPGIKTNPGNLILWAVSRCPPVKVPDCFDIVKGGGRACSPTPTSVRSYKRFLPQNTGLRRCWTSAPSTCRTGITYTQFLPSPCCVHRVNLKPHVFRDCTVHIEPLLDRAGSQTRGKISSCYSLGLYLRTLPKPIATLLHSVSLRDISGFSRLSESI